MVQVASTNTIIQTIVDERLRGRVMAFYTMAFFGSVPVGSLISGVVATYIGATTTIRVGGLVCIVAGLWFAMRLPVLSAAVRPIYISRGIIAPPDVGPRRHGGITLSDAKPIAGNNATGALLLGSVVGNGGAV